MTIRQLQSLITAGVFSSALLAGVSYADDMKTDAATPVMTDSTTATTKPGHKHKKHSMKNMAKHGCAGQNDCKGQGGCKTGDGGCAAKNSCKGKGGCATDGIKK